MCSPACSIVNAGNPAIGGQYNQDILIDISGLDDFPVRKIDHERICFLKMLYFHFSYCESSR